MKILKIEKPEKGMGKNYLPMGDSDGVVVWRYFGKYGQENYGIGGIKTSIQE
ncbi:MAG: hypothetical protein LBE98_00500 [Puniceicoccales bacterium]|jgi:hypothetical protein|nr:hypothetical protein [Puniceicoccales bacterium]